MADNVSHPRRLDPTIELITYSFVLYLQHGRHDVKCKPSTVDELYIDDLQIREVGERSYISQRSTAAKLLIGRSQIVV